MFSVENNTDLVFSQILYRTVRKNGTKSNKECTTVHAKSAVCLWLRNTNTEQSADYNKYNTVIFKLKKDFLYFLEINFTYVSGVYKKYQMSGSTELQKRWHY